MCKCKISPERILPFAALVGAVLISLILYRAVARPESFLTTSSPGGRYRVELTGSASRPRVPLVNNEVRFNAWKNSDGFLSQRYLYSGDWFDPSFEVLYPRHSWAGEGVLKFYGDDFDGRTPDTLIIKNETGRTVEYLKVTADCLLLLFDLQPDSDTELSVPAPRGGLRWLSAEGQYSSEIAIQKNGLDFIVPNGSKGPFTYYIVITDNGLRIESKELIKYSAP